MKSQSSGRTPSSLRLRWEVALALAVKIALVILIKIVFFSDAPSKAEVSNKVAERLAGSAQPAATTEIPTSTHHRE
ncbi:MAG: cytochrome oxidase putative small subunit CydP [Sterolibacterium sp.]